MFNKQDRRRNACMLTGKYRQKGYDWWWHSLTAINEETGEERPFFLEFFVCNPGLAKDEPTFGQLPENKKAGVRPSYLMVKAGCWGKGGKQLHRFFPWKDVDIHMDAPYSVRADDCFCSDDELRGRVSVTQEEVDAHPEYMCDAGEIVWDLKIEKLVAFNVGWGASGPMRALKAFEMFWHAEGMKSRYDGWITFNGERYKVIPEKSFGYADKNWGQGFTTPWLWLSSNDLVSKKTGKRLENSVFDIGGGKPKIGPIVLEGNLLSAFWYEGKAYEFNFSKFWTGCRTKFKSWETDEDIVWHVEQKTWRYKMITDITCKKEEMVLVNYEAPDGSKRHNRLWNGGNGRGTVKLYCGNELIDEVEAGHIGCEYGEYDKE